MNKRSFRLIGLFFVIIATLLPIIAIAGLNNLPFLSGIPSPKLLVAKRMLSDKLLPLVQNNKVELYNKANCGDKNFPDSVLRFYREEQSEKAKDPILDYFKPESKNQNCQFETTPILYLFDQNKKILSELTLEEANKFQYDSSLIDKIRGKNSVYKSSITINYNKNIQFVVERKQVTSITKLYNQEIISTNSVNQNSYQDFDYFEDENVVIIEPLGFLK